MAGDRLIITYQPYVDACIGAPPPPGWVPPQLISAQEHDLAVLCFVAGLIAGVLLTWLARHD